MGKDIQDSNAAASAALENKGNSGVIDTAAADKAAADKVAADKVAEEKAAAEKAAADKAAAEKSKVKSKKVKFKLSPCGKFKLPYNVDQVVSLPEPQANEIVESGYGEFVK